MTTGPEDLTAAEDHDRLRAADTDREQVIGTLQAAFTQARLTQDEFAARAGQALTARTHAELDALIADIPADPAVAPLTGAVRPGSRLASPATRQGGLAGRPRIRDRYAEDSVRARPADQGRPRWANGPGAHRADLRRAGRPHRRHPGRSEAGGAARLAHPGHRRGGARACTGPPLAAGQGGRQGGRLPDHRSGWPWGAAPSPIPAPPDPIAWATLWILLVFVAVCAALGFLVHGVATSIEQRRSRRRLPPRPGPGGRAPDGGRRGGTGRGPGSPGLSADQTRADVRAHKSREHRQHVPARAGRAPPDVRPAPGAA